MGAAFDDGSARHDENLIAAANGGKPVGDDDGGAIFHELIQGFLHEALAFGIEAAGGFIEDEDGRIREDGACNGEALALAAGDLRTALTHEGIVALR